MAKTKIDPAAILKRLQEEADADYLAFMEAQRVKKENALAEIIDPLKKERAELCTTVNDANTRIGEIDKELAKLIGTKAPAAKASGKRTRRNAEQMEAERKELLAAGSKLYAVLKKAGKGEQRRAIDLKAEALGANVAKALKPYLDAKLVTIHPNGKFTSYSFAKDGEL